MFSSRSDLILNLMSTGLLAFKRFTCATSLHLDTLSAFLILFNLVEGFISDLSPIKLRPLITKCSLKMIIEPTLSTGTYLLWSICY